MADEKVMPTIERRRKHAKIKERQKQRELEEKAQKVRVLEEGYGIVITLLLSSINVQLCIEHELFNLGF